MDDLFDTHRRLCLKEYVQVDLVRSKNSSYAENCKKVWIGVWRLIAAEQTQQYNPLFQGAAYFFLNLNVKMYTFHFYTSLFKANS